jgi:hypothetical protein
MTGRALSSAVEHQYHTLGVAGSKPAARTIIPKENGEWVNHPKETQNISGGLANKVKPK